MCCHVVCERFFVLQELLHTAAWTVSVVLVGLVLWWNCRCLCCEFVFVWNCESLNVCGWKRFFFCCVAGDFFVTVCVCCRWSHCLMVCQSATMRSSWTLLVSSLCPLCFVSSCWRLFVILGFSFFCFSEVNDFSCIVCKFQFSVVFCTLEYTFSRDETVIELQNSFRLIFTNLQISHRYDVMQVK